MKVLLMWNTCIVIYEAFSKYNVKFETFANNNFTINVCYKF